jgi:hypothetical protein
MEMTGPERTGLGAAPRVPRSDDLRKKAAPKT